MKTALQELRDILENKSSCHEYGQSDYKDGLKVSLTTAITFIDYFIEKEKKQIIDAYEWGLIDGEKEAKREQKYDHSGSSFYEDFYTQNK